MDCVFCRILAKKASRSLVYEDGLTATFLDIHPVTVGHLLVVPKMHVERFSQLPDHVAAQLFLVARKLVAALEASEIPSEGANLFLSDGAIAGQEVPHAHLHIAPRTHGDGQRMGFVDHKSIAVARSELDAVARILREALDKNSEGEKRDVVDVIAQPVLETERLLLRPFTPEDADAVFAYASNPEVSRFLPWVPHENLDDTHAFFEYVHRSVCYDRRRLFYVFALEEKKSGRVIGSIDFKKIYDHMGQIDYAIGAPDWGKGFTAEAVDAIRDWAFRALPELVRIQAYCIAENRQSSRVMEKIGMKKEGRRAKAYLLKNEAVDLCDYAILRADWETMS